MATDPMTMHPDILRLRAKYEVAGSQPIAQAVDGLTFLTGLYLAISPWIVGFDNLARLTVNNLIVGVALAVLALGFASAYDRTHGIAWTVPVVGIWTIIAPWVIRGDVATTATIWNNVVTGVVALVLGLGAMSLASSSMLSRPRPATR